MQGQVTGVLMIEVNQVLYIPILLLLLGGALRSSHHCLQVWRQSRLIAEMVGAQSTLLCCCEVPAD